MTMSKKSYNIWMAILDNPFEWQDMTSLGKQTDLTARQVSAMITHMSDPRIERRNAMVRFAGDDGMVEATRREVIMQRFDISDDDILRVRRMLSPSGVTLMEICAGTNCKKANVSRILRMMDDVSSRSCHDETLYFILAD